MARDLDEYLAAIQLGDEQAFGSWMAAVEPKLRGSLRSFASDIDVEAVVQETFLQIWQVAPKFKSDGGANSLLRFAFRCVRNLAISETRRLRSRPQDVDELERSLIDADEVTSPVETDPALRRVIGDCASRLPPKPRAAIVARLMGGGADPDHTLAERLGMTLNTFLQNVTRARKLLLACLEEAGIDMSEQFA